jgi:hypothetical protein
MIWNSKYATDPFQLVQNDDVDISLNIQKYNQITKLWENYDLSGKDLRMVIVNKHGTIIADWSTATGELTNVLSVLYINTSAVEAISCCGSFDGQLVELLPQLTLWRGVVNIEGSLI